MGKWQIAQVVNLQTWVRILLNSAIICFDFSRYSDYKKKPDFSDFLSNYDFYIFLFHNQIQHTC